LLPKNPPLTAMPKDNQGAEHIFTQTIFSALQLKPESRAGVV